jgi:hypothetical protein
VQRSTQRRMSRKRQFCFDCKDTDFLSFLSFSGGIARQNESRFRKIHLPRQSLHFAVIQSSSVSEDRERITGEWRLRKNIELNKFVRAVPHNGLVHVYPNTCNKTLVSCWGNNAGSAGVLIWLLLRLTRTLNDQTTAS